MAILGSLSRGFSGGATEFLSGVPGSVAESFPADYEPYRVRRGQLSAAAGLSRLSHCVAPEKTRRPKNQPEYNHSATPRKTADNTGCGTWHGRGNVTCSGAGREGYQSVQR